MKIYRLTGNSLQIIREFPPVAFADGTKGLLDFIFIVCDTVDDFGVKRRPMIVLSG